MQKELEFENVLNRERFFCKNDRDIEIIDNVKYLKVHRLGNDRMILLRKDVLKRIKD